MSSDLSCVSCASCSWMEAQSGSLPDTLTTVQPRSVAMSPSWVRRTVFPEPPKPVILMRRLGAPGPLSKPSTKSSITPSRPMSTGGVMPAVGLNGFINFSGLGMSSSLAFELHMGTDAVLAIRYAPPNEPNPDPRRHPKREAREARAATAG